MQEDEIDGCPILDLAFKQLIASFQVLSHVSKIAGRSMFGNSMDERIERRSSGF